MAVVVALVYVNQFLFNAFVLRVHHGDPGFIAHYLPGGWFSMAHQNSVVRWLARRSVAGDLGVTTLRVQAALELPFVLAGYLSVLRWLDADLSWRVARSSMIWFASAAYTVVFCTIEWGLRNPDTIQDIVIRAISAVVTPLLIRWIAGRRAPDPDARSQPRSLLGLMVFGASVCALGYLVLVVYDTALLYNLGLLGASVPHALIALLALGILRFAAAYVPAAKAEAAAYTTLVKGAVWMLILFFVPALAVRYCVGFGTEDLAGGAVVVLGAVALAHALREGLAVPVRGRTGRPVSRPVILGWFGVALAAGLAAAYLAVVAEPYSYYEEALPRAFGAGLVTVIAACALLDRVWNGRPTAVDTSGAVPRDA